MRRDSDRVSDELELLDADLLTEEDPSSSEPSQLDAGLREAIERELGATGEPHRRAQLHYELGQCFEQLLGDPERVLAEYREALSLTGEHLPSLRGAQRTALALDRPLEAAELVAAEAEATPEPTDAARVHYRLGGLFETELDDARSAQRAYQRAHVLEPSEPTYLDALERMCRRLEDWESLSTALEERANVAGDSEHRVALLVERARLHETRLGDPETAAELYRAAQALSAGAPGVAEALVRLYRTNQNLSGSIAALEQAVALSEDPRDRAEQLYHLARLRTSELGDRVAGMASLESAVRDAPDQPLLLDALIQLHHKAGNRSRVVELLQQRVEVTEQPDERAALLHQLGQELETAGESTRAVTAYQAAIALVPTYVPALQALGALLAERGDWDALVDMHRGEAQVAQSTRRRAAAHRRTGELLERKLARLDQAAEAYGEALVLEPGDPGSFKALARLWAQLGEHRKLIELYERAVDETVSVPRKIAYLFKAGSLWEDALNEPSQAVGVYARVLELAADDLGALHALQRVCERAEKWEQLVTYLLREAELTDDRALELSLRRRAAEILDEHLDESDRARNLLEQVVSDDPGHLPALIALGRIHYRAGRWRELLRMYEGELEVTDDTRERAILQTRMAELCEHKLGEAARAVELYQQAADDDPQYRPATAALVRMLTDVGDRSGLLDRLEGQMTLLDAPGPRAQLAVQIASLHEDDGDLERAIQRCRDALAEVPDYRPAVRALERLLEQAERWEELEPLLEQDARDTTCRRRQLVASLRRAELLREELQQPEQALAAYRQARSAGAEMAALLPLAQLYEHLGRTAEQVQLETEIASHVSERAERAAALREVARLLARGRESRIDELIEACEAVLEAAPEDSNTVLLLCELASRSEDSERLSRSLARLGRLTGDSELAGHYWLCLAQQYERTSDDRAMTTYTAVLDKVPGSLTAARGLERVADKAFDGNTRAVALRSQAALTTDARRASDLLVEAAGADTVDERSVADVERALELWPDSARAAALLTRLTDESQGGRLIDLLSRAANAASQLDRKAALWHQIGQTYQRQGDLGAAVAAVKRGLTAAPGDLVCRRTLADLYLANEQWSEAIVALNTMSSSADTPISTARASLLEQAELWEQKLGKRDLALARAREALALDPLSRETLAVVAELERLSGRTDEALGVARELLSVSTQPADRAEALAILGAIEADAGNVAGAMTTLCQAIAEAGVDSRAYSMVRALVDKSGDWHAVATAIDEHTRGDVATDSLVSDFLALADVYQSMELPGKAVAALERGIALTRRRELAGPLAELIRRHSPALAGAEQLRTLIDMAPDEPILWRALADCEEAAGRGREARRAASALGLMDVASRPAVEALPLAHLNPGSIDAVAMAAAIPNGAGERPVAELIAAVSEAIGRAIELPHPPASLSRRERVTARHPLEATLERLSNATGVSCEAYVRPGLDRPVNVVLDDTLTILLDESMSQRSAAEQCILIARPLVLATMRLHPVLALPIASLEQIVRAAAADDAAATELSRQLRKATPRRQRKALEAAAAAYRAQPEASIAAWRRDILRGAARLAAVLADDVAAAIALAGARDHGDAPGPAGRLPPPMTADLLAFWLSDTAIRLRNRAGL